MTAIAARIPDVSLDAASRFVAASGFIVDEVTDTRLRGHVELGEAGLLLEAGLLPIRSQ